MFMHVRVLRLCIGGVTCIPYLPYSVEGEVSILYFAVSGGNLPCGGTVVTCFTSRVLCRGVEVTAGVEVHTHMRRKGCSLLAYLSVKIIIILNIKNLLILYLLFIFFHLHQRILHKSKTGYLKIKMLALLLSRTKI